jgi:hypothetical protein
LPLDDERRAENEVWLAFTARALIDPQLRARHAEIDDALRAASLRAVEMPGLPAGQERTLEAERLHAQLDGLASTRRRDPSGCHRDGSSPCSAATSTSSKTRHPRRRGRDRRPGHAARVLVGDPVLRPSTDPSGANGAGRQPAPRHRCHAHDRPAGHRCRSANRLDELLHLERGSYLDSDEAVCRHRFCCGQPLCGPGFAPLGGARSETPVAAVSRASSVKSRGSRPSAR